MVYDTILAVGDLLFSSPILKTNEKTNVRLVLLEKNHIQRRLKISPCSAYFFCLGSCLQIEVQN